MKNKTAENIMEKLEAFKQNVVAKLLVRMR